MHKEAHKANNGMHSQMECEGEYTDTLCTFNTIT